jgi:hypothetical protein
MSGWDDLPADVRAFVEQTLAAFPLQLEAWRLRESDRSWRTIALVQGVSKTTVRDRVAAADLRLRKAGLRQNAHGRFSIQGVA